MAQTNQPANLLDRIVRLERELAEVRKRAGLGNAVSRGSFRFVDTAGNLRIYFGPVAYGPNVTMGWIMRRATGGTVFELGGGSDTSQFWALRDEDGNILVGDDAATGQGLARPYIPLQAVPTSWHVTRQQSTTNTGFTPLWTVSGLRQHPRLQVHLMVQCDVGVSAEIRVNDPTTSTVIAGPLSLAAGAFTYVTLVGALPAGAYMAQFKVDVEMRVAGGAGTVGSSLIYALGVQS